MAWCIMRSCGCGVRWWPSLENNTNRYTNEYTKGILMLYPDSHKNILALLDPKVKIRGMEREKGKVSTSHP